MYLPSIFLLITAPALVDRVPELARLCPEMDFDCCTDVALKCRDNFKEVTS